jgi:hypothetical protein
LKAPATLAQKLNINENFISKIWETGKEFYSGLKTTDGEPVKVVDIGISNYDSGPDYKNARIQIGDKTYLGDVEIHRDFKGWREHSHKKDSSYNSVILQVVLWNTGQSEKPKLRKKRNLPTVILSDYLNYSIHEIWQEIISKPSGKFRIPCYGLKASISNEDTKTFLAKLSIERLTMKSNRIKDRIKELETEAAGSAGRDNYLKKSSLWKQVLYEFTFEALGYSKNKEQMLKLASGLKLKLIEKTIQDKDSLHIQAVLFGASGLLFDVRIKDSYINNIKYIWDEVKEKFPVQKLNKSEWKFFRLRPQNFPTIRIAYSSQLIQKIIAKDLFKNIIIQFRGNNFKVKECFKSLSELLTPEYDDYWSVHYNFGKETKKAGNLLGKERLNDIITNVLIPLVYLYAVIFSDKEIKANVLKLYNELQVHAGNSVLNIMSEQVLAEKGIEIKSPAAEQAVMQLYNFYCTRERCNECKIGQSITKDKGFNYRIIFY